MTTIQPPLELRWENTSFYLDTAEGGREHIVEFSTHDGEFFHLMEIQRFKAPEGHLAWTITGYRSIIWAGAPDVEEFYHELEFPTKEAAQIGAQRWDAEMDSRIQ